MYPWRERLNSWAQGAGFRIDALGLVTLLGAEEMDRSIGRLVPNPYLDYLPLLGAFVVAGDRFTEKQSGFALYNVSAGIMTTELAGWFSRWLRTQDLYKVRSIITWEIADRPPRWTAFLVGFLLIALPAQGMLIALTVLAADWWGFANVVAMIVSVVVKCVLVAQNQAGIDANIRRAQEEAHNYRYAEKRAKYEEAMARLENLRQQDQSIQKVEKPIEPKDPYAMAKVIVVTDDSNAVTIAAPGYLIKSLFSINPEAPNRLVYGAFRSIGWAAFAVHVISIGMAALYTQIYTVVVILVATILTANKVGCDDSTVWRTIWNKLSHEVDEDQEHSCWVSSRLKATVSSYPAWYADWSETQEDRKTPRVQVVDEKGIGQWWNRRRTAVDLESTSPERKKPRKDVVERRQDLYAWLDLTTEEDTYMTAWGLIPRSHEWHDAYLTKKMIHRKRTGRGGTQADPDPEATEQ